MISMLKYPKNASEADSEIFSSSRQDLRGQAWRISEIKAQRYIPLFNLPTTLIGVLTNRISSSLQKSDHISLVPHNPTSRPNLDGVQCHLLQFPRPEPSPKLGVCTTSGMGPSLLRRLPTSFLLLLNAECALFGINCAVAPPSGVEHSGVRNVIVGFRCLQLLNSADASQTVGDDNNLKLAG